AEPAPPAAPAPPAPPAVVQKEMEQLSQQSAQLDRENRDRAAQIEQLMGQIETLDRNSSNYKDELERVKLVVGDMEQTSESAIEFLTEAYQQLQTTQWTLEDLEFTLTTMKEVFHLLAGEVSQDFLPEIIVDWF